MQKKYVVRLTDEERNELQEVVKRLKGTSQKVRRAQILLKADADGPNWTDEQIADAFSCRTRTVEKIRQRLVERGFEDTLHGLERTQPPVEAFLSAGPGAALSGAEGGSRRRDADLVRLFLARERAPITELHRATGRYCGGFHRPCR